MTLLKSTYGKKDVESYILWNNIWGISVKSSWNTIKN